MKTILANKGQMRTFFDKEGGAVAATEVIVGPCVVTALRTREKDGYEAVQLGFGERIKRIKKAEAGLVKKLALKSCPRVLREVKMDNESIAQVGQEVKIADVLKEGDSVSVSGISKGKGFAGVVKRWHFKGGPKTHGQSDRQRAPGSIGSTTTPGRVYKGKKMAGRMGSDRITVKNLQILKIDLEKNLMVIKGALPGKTGGLLLIAKEK